MADFSYSPVGMTADGGPPPPGFRALRVRVPLGPGDFDAAAAALFGWEMHRATPLVRVAAGTPPAAPGVDVLVRMGPLRAPCRVVWTVREENRTGFGYGTLPGHPERGEESFLLARHPDGSVDFTVYALSTPAAWYLKAAGPSGRLVQRLVARRYGRALRTLARAR